MAKIIPWSMWHIHIIFKSNTFSLVIGRAVRMVIVNWNLTCTSGHGHGKTAAWIIFSDKHLNNCFRPLLCRIPCLQNRIQVLAARRMNGSWQNGRLILVPSTPSPIEATEQEPFFPPSVMITRSASATASSASSIWDRSSPAIG